MPRNTTTRATGILTMVLLAALVGTAQSNFAGTWKLNVAKSQLGGPVYTFEKKPTGIWHYSGSGFEADFDLTGKEFTMPSGVSIAAKEVNATSWDLIFRMNGKVTSTSKVTLNGDSLNWVSDVIGADGKSIQQSNIDTRVSGGPGFAGKWKTGEMKGASTTLKITVEPNGITIEAPELQTVTKGSFDGKDYAVTQAGQPTKFTSVFARTGSTLKVTTKLNGKVFAEDEYTLSADGKTLTDEATATATNEKTKAVFERQ